MRRGRKTMKRRRRTMEICPNTSWTMKM